MKPMIKYLKAVLIFAVLLLLSCDSKVEKDIIGTWIIDEIFLDNKTIKDSLLANAFILKKDKSCDLPIVNVKDNHSEKEKGKWLILERKSDYFLSITSTNELFRGEYKIESISKLKDDAGGVSFKMKISNKRLIIICSKIAFVP